MGATISTASLTPSSENLAEPPIQLSKLARKKLALTAIASENDLTASISIAVRITVSMPQRASPAISSLSASNPRAIAARDSSTATRASPPKSASSPHVALIVGASEVWRCTTTSGRLGCHRRIWFRRLVGLNLDWRFGRGSLRDRIFRRRRDTPRAFTLGFHLVILASGHALVALHKRNLF